MKTIGEWPIRTDPDLEAEVRCVPTHGGMIVDTMDLGKTYLALLFINFVAVHGPAQEPYKPIRLILDFFFLLEEQEEQYRGKQKSRAKRCGRRINDTA